MIKTDADCVINVEYPRQVYKKVLYAGQSTWWVCQGAKSTADSIRGFLGLLIM